MSEQVETPTEPRGHPRSLGLLRYMVFLLLGVGAALAGMRLIPASEYSLGPVSISTKAQVGPAGSTLEVPPLGTLFAVTHRAPLSLTVTVTEVNPQAIGRILSGSPDQAALIRDLTVALRGAATGLAIRILVASVVLGAVVLALLPGRHWSSVVVGSLGAAGAAAVLLAITWASFRPEAFREPQFTGALERAPQLIQAIQGQAITFGEARSRIEGAAARLSEVLALIGQPVGDPNSDTVAILHISDVHSNPLGVEFAKQLASNFRVDAILDTGDLTSFGEPIEARIGMLISEANVPYVFVPGNHDSDPIRVAVSQLPRAIVLDKRVEDVKGVRILGWGDPAFTARNEISLEGHDLAISAEAPRVAQALHEQKPDVLAVHDPNLARASYGRVPLVLAGHGHRRATKQTRGTRLFAVGSTGATGLGSFLAEADRPYEAQILYFRDGQAVAIDYVRFRGLGNDFEIDRRSLKEPAPSTPTPTPSPGTTAEPTPVPQSPPELRPSPLD